MVPHCILRKDIFLLCNERLVFPRKSLEPILSFQSQGRKRTRGLLAYLLFRVCFWQHRWGLRRGMGLLRFPNICHICRGRGLPYFSCSFQYLLFPRIFLLLRILHLFGNSFWLWVCLWALAGLLGHLDGIRTCQRSIEEARGTWSLVWRPTRCKHGSELFQYWDKFLFLL